MVLEPAKFKLRTSLKKRIKQFAYTPGCEIRIDSAFERVIQACAQTPRQGQAGTWIVPDMQQAYRDLANLGVAHSVETWVNGELIGGLYGLGIGRMVFGESMFHWQTDASKIALAALVAFCRFHAMPLVDCQQATAHLASLGARLIPRTAFLAAVDGLIDQSAPNWHFSPAMWACLLPEVFN
jgi:leucyl/phenylalanyl-tRNA--protein transferase